MRSGGAVLMADTIRLEGTETYEVVIQGRPQTTSGSFTLQLSTGGRMRLEGLGANSRSLHIRDGENAWNYLAATRMYTKTPQTRGPTNDGYGRLKFSRDPAAFRDPKVEREETLEFGGRQVACYVVHAAYQSMPGNPGAREVTRTVWIAKSDDRIFRDTWEVTEVLGPGLPSVPARMTTNYTVIESGMPLPDDLFVFHPPDGSALASPAAGAKPKSFTPPSFGPRASGSPSVLPEVKPEYSTEARAAGLQGTISLYVEQKADGHPGNIHVLQGLGLGLDEKAIEAVNRLESAPAGIREIDVQFRLDQPAPWNVVSEGFWIDLPPQPDPHPVTVVKPVPKRYVAPDAFACQSSGEAVVSLSIGADGNPREVRAVGGENLAVDGAVKAVGQWQFAPATADGAPVEAHGEVEFECRLEGMLLRSEQTALPIYRVGGGVSAPMLISKREPEYSEEARKARKEGKTLFYVQISPDGKATGIRVVQVLGMGLDEKAMEAVKLWHFKPGMKDGLPVTVEATIEVNFKLL
jgi:TonB family protein